eukprot:jgi/Chlat1/5781/Chrsp387S00877
MGDAAGVHSFGSIYLGGRAMNANQGQLRVHQNGFLWRRAGGGKLVEVSKSDISRLQWMRMPKAFQLVVCQKAGQNVKFDGFREADLTTLTEHAKEHFGMELEEQQLALTGRNWGDCDIRGSMLNFKVGGKQAFDLPLADVSQAMLQGKNEVVIQFHIDDTTGASEKDSLVELSFHIPQTNPDFEGDDDVPSAKVFHSRITEQADVGVTGDAIVAFDEIAVTIPRGRYHVELHSTFLRLQGQANDFKIQYSSVMRLFVLPKGNLPQTLVIICLDPPIRKGQTFYPHILLQFPADEETECDLEISEEVLKTKYEGKLQSSYKGLSHDVFSKILKGLSGTKLSKPGTFRSASDGVASVQGFGEQQIRCSLKADEGYLYPLERCFFAVHKPPALIPYDDVDYIEFERQGQGGSMNSAKTFDLYMRLKTEMDYQFRNIQRSEYSNLFSFITAKKLRITNMEDAAKGPGGQAATGRVTDLDDVDPHMNMIDEESDEEDEDFNAGEDTDGGSPTESSEGGSDASGAGGGGDASDADSDEVQEVRKEKMRKSTPPPTAKRKEKEKKEPAPKKAKKAPEPADGGKQKKEKKKKDPNAPKRGMSAYMFFANANRDKVKAERPGISFGEVGKVLGERWKSLSAEEKKPYEQQAAADKSRYGEQMKAYKPDGDGAGPSKKESSKASKKPSKQESESSGSEDKSD